MEIYKRFDVLKHLLDGLFLAVLFNSHVTYAAYTSSVWPRYGSLAGETRLTIYGSGFSANQFSQNDDPNTGNLVYLVGESGNEMPCAVHKDGCTEIQIMCYTPDKMPEQSYDVKVVVDGVTIPDANMCLGNPSSDNCKYSPQSRYTPTMTSFSPQYGKPGDFVYMEGTFFTDRYGSNTEIALNGRTERILRVYVGPTDCGLKDGDSFYDLSLRSENSDYGQLKCKTKGKSFGFFNASFIIESPFGRSKIDHDIYRVSYKDDIYMYQLYEDITSVSPNKGSTAGGLTLTINAKNIDNRLPYTDPKAYVGDTECLVTNVVLDQYIECTVAADPSYTATKHAGNRGANFEYWKSVTSMSNLDDILDMTSSTSDYESTTLDETNYMDVNDTMDNYVSRMTTYFSPPHTGQYEFQLKGDDKAKLFMDRNILVQSTGNWAYSSRVPLTKGRRYLLEVVHHEITGDSYFFLRARFFDTAFTHTQLGKASPERQTVKITSTVEYEEQELAFSDFTPRDHIEEVQILNISTAGKVRIGVYGVFTDVLDINNVAGGTLSAALNALPIFSTGESMEAERLSSESGAVFKVTFKSKRGDFPNIEVVKVSKDDAMNYTVVQDVQGSPDMKTVALKFGGKVSDPFSVSGLTHTKLHTVISGLFEAKCPAVLSDDAKVYLDYETTNGQFSGSITNEEEAFSGRYVLKNPYRIFRIQEKTPGIRVSLYKWLCFAYKGLFTNYIRMSYTYKEATTNNKFTRTDYFAHAFSRDTSTSSTSWYYTCFDMYTNIKNIRGSYSDHRVEQIWVEKASADDVFFDALFIGKSITTTDLGGMRNLRRRRPFLIKGAAIKEETVTKISDLKFKIVLKPYDCGNKFPLFELANGKVTAGKVTSSSSTATLKLKNGGAGSVVVVRKVEASPPVEGTVDLTFNQTTKEALNVSLEGVEFQKELETLKGIGSLTVQKSGDCAKFDLSVTFETLPGDLPEMTVSSNDLVGIDAAAIIVTDDNGSVYYDPLTGDMISTVHSKTQVRLMINDVPLACTGDCSFEWDAASTPTITAVSPNSGTSALDTTMTITGSKFSSTPSQNTVTIGNVNCPVTAATSSSITCDVGNGPVGSHKVIVTVVDKGDAAHSSGDVTFEYTAAISSILPTKGSLGGGITLTINGYGFKAGASVTINSKSCTVLSILANKITCTVPAQTSTGTFDVIVSSGVSRLTHSGGFQYDSSLTATVSDVSPSVLKVAGGRLTISGSGFGDNQRSVYVGTERATIVSWSDSSVVVDVGSGNPGVTDVKVDTTYGFAVLSSSNALPTVIIDLSITNVYPLLGSVQGGIKLTITGTGFGNTDTLVDITVGDVPCDISAITDTRIDCMIANAGKVHRVTNRGTDRAFGIFYAFDKPYVTVNSGDFVLWSWKTPDFVNDVAHAIIEVESPSAFKAKPGGFTSGTPTKNGQFQYQFTKTGKYYVWSGYVDKYWIKNYVGTIEVVDAVSTLAQIDVKVSGRSAIHSVTGSSNPTDSSSCQAVTSSKSGCPDTLPSGDDVNKFNFAFWTCSTPIVNSVSEKNGTVKTDITLQGEGLSDSDCQNEVTFGTSPCLVTSSFSTSVTCNLDKVGTPTLGVVHPLSVRVGNRGYALINIMTTEDHSFGLVPNIEDIQPLSGSLAGGAVLTITGFGFGSTPSVTVGGYTCNIVSNTFSEIQCETPGSKSQVTNSKDVDVRIMINGVPFTATCETRSRTCTYIYSSALSSTVTAISPGDLAGATTFTISGTSLGTVTSDLDVTIGGESAVVTAASDTEIAVTLSNLPAGSNNVIVKVKDYGKASGSLTVTGTANITSVSPASGSTYGQQLVTIQGNGFVDGQTTVTLDGADCSITSISLAEVVCLTPAHNAGTVSLAVTSNSVSYSPESFDYATSSTPTVDSISPQSGLPGSTLTITGSNLAGGSVTVQLDDVPCAVTSSSSSEIQCALGNHATGSVPVSVHVTALGASNTNVEFEYQLSLSSISPTQGSIVGGQRVILTGTGFISTASVTICDEPCLLQTTTSTEYVCKTPVVSAQTCDVEISVNGLKKSLTDSYTYDADLTPTVSGVSPKRGGTGGGTTLTVTGSDFGTSAAAAKVTIDGADCAVTTVTDSQITCQTGPHTGSIQANVEVEIGGNGIALESSSGAADFEYIDVWSSSFTWGGGPLPAAGEFIVIPAGQTILLDTSTPVLKFLLIQGGKLIFDEADIELQSEIILITDGGLLQVGTEAAPFQHKGIITLHGHPRSKELPIYGTKVLALRIGTLDLHGIEVPVTWTRLAETAGSGSTSLTLVDPVQWNVGDEIVIASTGDHHSQSENEKKKITGISGDKKTLTVDSAMEAEHVGTEETFDGTLVEFRAEVGLLTHNVVVRGNTDPQWEDEIEACEAGFNTGEFATQTCFLGRFGDEIGSNQFGATIMVHSPADTHEALAKISYTEVTFAGQAFRLGRYPIHFHLNGDMSTSYVRGCGIHHTFNRAINIHGTHNTLVEKTVIYNIMGGAFFLEDGIETGNTLQLNLAVFVHQSSSLQNDDVTPASFWITNPNNTVQHNAAAGGSHFGFWYRMHDKPDGPSFDPNVCCKKIPLGMFYNNTAHSQGWFGLWIFPDYFPVQGGCGGSVPEPAVFKLLIAWNCEKGAESVNGGSLQFDAFILVQNKKAGYEGKLINPMYAPKYTDDSPMVINSLIVGKTTVIPNSVQGCTFGGIIFPHGFGFQVINVRFFNFADSSCAVFRFATIDGTCSDKCGGFSYHIWLVSFTNAPNKASYAWEFEGILIDRDGTLTGKPSGWQVIPTSGTIPSDCEDIADFSFGIPASVCPPQLKFHRFSFNQPTPTSLEGKNFILRNQYGNSTVPFMKKRITHKFGWMCILVGGLTYVYEFENAQQITNISYKGVYYGFESSDYIIIEKALKKPPDRVSITGGSQFINSTTGDLDPSTAKNGDWVWLNEEKKVKAIVTGGGRSKRSTTGYGDDIVVSFTAYNCFYDDCIPPLDPSTIPPAHQRPLDFDYWTDGTLWNDTDDGYITADINRNSEYGIPKKLDNVKIPYGMWVVINATAINKLGTLRLEGVLEIIDTDGYSYELNADFIIIMGGRLVAGWSYDPFEKATLSIILRGNHSSPIFSEGDGPNVGSKAIGVFGGLDLFGKEVDVAWTQLAVTAIAGAKQIVVNDEVKWSEDDEIVVGPTSFDVWQTETFKIRAVAADNVTLTLNDTLKYRHIAHSEIINGQSLYVAAAVGLLTRNIKIIGEDYSDLYTESFGARVLVGAVDTVDRAYVGYARLSNVEFYHTGQEGFTEEYDPRFSVAYVATGTVDDLRPSFIRKCAFRNGFNSAIGAFGISGLSITDNVVYHTVGHGIQSSADNTRIINNMVVLVIWTGAYQDRAEPFNFRWEAGIEAITAKNLTLQDNLVTGSERIGIHVHPLECGDTSGRISNNRIQSNFIGYLIFAPDVSEISCALISGFTAWKNHDFGIYYQGSVSTKIENNVLVDNRQGVFTLIVGPKATEHKLDSKTVEISNSLLVGATFSFDCATDVTPSDDNVDLGSNGRPRMALTGGMIGIVFPNFMSGSNNAPIKPFPGIMTYPAIRGLMTISDVTFAHYGATACKGDFAVATNGANDDGQHPIESRQIHFADVDENYKIGYHRPNLGVINSADCVDMDCDAMKKALFKDLDGTFLGSVGAVLPQSEYEWGGDPRRGLGDYRIPKEMVTTLDGTRIPYNTLMPNKGVLRSNNCTYMKSWQAYKCFDYNWEMLIMESMDGDTETRRISPVAVLSQGYVDLINGPQDHGWCSGYTCRKRLSTFMAIVATNFDSLVHFTGTTPEHMRYHLLNVDANQGIKLTVWYSRPNRLDVYVNGTYVMPTNSEINELGYNVFKMPVGDEFEPMFKDPTGTNYFDRYLGELTVIIKGLAVVDVITADVILVSFGLPTMTVTDFFGANIVEHIAGFLDIPLTKVRVVNVVSAASSGRQKRSESGINVDIEIGDEPTDDLNSTVADSMDHNTLLLLASSLVNECQVGNISQTLNITGTCNSMVVPGESATDETVAYSTQIPSQLLFYHEPIPIYEGYLLQQQPKIQASDIYNIVVTELGTNEYPWQLSVSLRSGTGHSDAILGGSLTVNASNGWFNFTDLEISHMGTGYILDFSVTYPTVAENFTLASPAFDVAGRPIKAKILPMSLGGDLTPSSQFAVTLDLRDANSDQTISNITWRSHTWSVSARILGNPNNGSIGGITSTMFDPDTSQAIFPDLRFNHFGIYYIQFLVVSTPAEYSFTLNHKMVTTNVKFADKTLEKQIEISMKFDVTFDTVLPDEDKQNEFDQYIMEHFVNLFTDVDFQASSLWRGSIVATFVIGGSTIDVNATAYTLCDMAHNGTSYNFYGYSVSLSKYMTIDNETFYGIACHVEEPVDDGDDDDDDDLHPGLIAAFAIIAFIIVAGIVGVIVWVVCVKPKTKTHSMRVNRTFYDEDKTTGNWYIKEATFTGAEFPQAPPVSALYNSPYTSDRRRMSAITVHLHSPEPNEISEPKGRFSQPSSHVFPNPPDLPEAKYLEPSDSSTPSPSCSRGSSSPEITKSPITNRLMFLQPSVNHHLYNSEYIRTPMPKITSPSMPESNPSPWRKVKGEKKDKRFV